jgi:predicted phosphoribosyltransferase
MLAAIDVVLAKRPHELIVAVPVGSADRLLAVRNRCDRLICLRAPASFSAVGEFYNDFEQVSDETAVGSLREFATVGRPAM